MTDSHSLPWAPISPGLSFKPLRLADQDYGAEHMARVVADRRATRADSSAAILAAHEPSAM